MVENGGVASRAMIDAGYSPQTAKVPGKLTDSKGFMEVYAELGLTPGLVTQALVEDIKGKPKRRLGEMNLAAEVLGMKKNAETRSEQPSVIVNILQRYEAHGGTGEETAGLVQ